MKPQELSNIQLEDLLQYKRIILIGPTDVGKSYFVKNLANLLINKGYKSFVADLDVGQTNIGPVGTIGVGVVKNPFLLFSELEPVFLYFTGFSAPSFDIIGYLMGVRKLALFINKIKPKRLIIDTTGWISGYNAFSLKLYKIDVLKPECVILIGEEVWEWGELFKKMGIETIKALPSRFAVEKDTFKRKINRYKATSDYFSDAPLFKVNLEDFIIVNPIESFNDLKGRLFGLFDKKMNTTAIGWIVKVEFPFLLAKLRIISKTKAVFIRIGSKVTLEG